jgi:cytochrome P450
MSLVSIDTPEEIADPSDKKEPFTWFREMRHSNPIRYDPSRDVWDVFKYHHVEEVLSDHTSYSNDVPIAVGENEPLANSMMFSDRPRHTRLRDILEGFFRPSIISRCEIAIRKKTVEILENKASDDKLDVVNDFGFPVSIITLAEFLGIPSGDQDIFLDYAWKILRSRPKSKVVQTKEKVNSGGNPRDELIEYFSTLITARRDELQEGLISYLVDAKQDSNMDTDDIVGVCDMMLVGGSVPAFLLANVIYSLDQFGGLSSTTGQNNDTIQEMIEETLRFRSTTQALPRLAQTDTQLGDQRINKGDRLMLWIASANRDEKVFKQPDSFVIGRKESQHLAFGSGIHYCIGARIARMEVRVMLSELFNRLERIDIRKGKAEPHMNPIILGFESLPIDFNS